MTVPCSIGVRVLVLYSFCNIPARWKNGFCRELLAFYRGLARVSCKEGDQESPILVCESPVMALCCNAHQIDVIVCAQLCPICPARGWGVVWLVFSMGFWAGGVCYLVLHVGNHLDL